MDKDMASKENIDCLYELCQNDHNYRRNFHWLKICMPFSNIFLTYSDDYCGDASGTSPLQVTLEHTLPFKLQCSSIA